MIELADWWDEFLRGAWVIVQLFFAGLVMSIAWGLMGAAAKLSNNRFAKTVANIFTVICRGTPEFLVLLIVYFGSAVTLTSIIGVINPEIKYADLPPFWAGAFAISLVIGAYATETFRGAFLGIDKGLIEASHALGISKVQTFFFIRIPLMWRIALPNLGNHMLSLLKDTALVSVIGVEEIMYTAEMGSSYTMKPFSMYFTVALIFLFFSTIIIKFVSQLEKYAYRHL